MQKNCGTNDINPWQRPISHTSGTGRSPFRSLINQSFLARERERENETISQLIKKPMVLKMEDLPTRDILEN